MARIVDHRLRSSASESLTPAQYRTALRKLAQARRSNPLRVVRLGCHGPVRDASAQVGDLIWCEACADFVAVESVSE